ncbi:hypothetical protein FHG85_08155 [Tenuifilum thalassicum]|uniref:Polysaccharide biosynthesis protein C-terminal domain-containing protein n=1 Tax=Tenuifilum thalassicum TaxID=2590900 RepID=A0A7D4AXM6_9BACT|nr:polysaccharide biosynthesis C-terminal domain-containing protein [Tenuifilum thalassicum]QKG80234.1 hypothetical protein FHG85_08155 [Tenuifilum thalassicum]
MFINRYMIEYYLGTKYVGIFTFAYSLSFSLFLILYIGGLVFQPYLYKSKTVNESSEKNLLLYTNSMFIFISIFAFLLWYSFKFIINYYSNDYLSSEESFRILMLSILIIPFYHQGNYRLTLKNMTHFLPIASGLAAISSIILNLIFIPRYGIVGAAYSSVISYLVIMIFTNFISTNIRKLGNSKTIISIIFISVIILFYNGLIHLLPFFLIISVLMAGVEIYSIKN